MAVNENDKKGSVRRSVGMQATVYGEVEDIESWEKLDFAWYALASEPYLMGTTYEFRKITLVMI